MQNANPIASERPWQDTIKAGAEEFSYNINALCRAFHEANKEAGWWDKSKEQKDAQIVLEKYQQQLPDEARVILEGLVRKPRDPLHMQILMISEIIEAMEGIRKNLMDDKLPEEKMEDVEMADVFLRLVDYCGGRGINLGDLVVKKAIFNMTREDHSKESREGKHGKQF